MDVSCDKCGDEFVVSFDDPVGDGPVERASWSCPACGWRHEFPAVGRVVDVGRRGAGPSRA